MAPILTITGATGTQGGSVIEAAFLNVRGVTRNVSSPSAKELSARGVEMGSSAIFVVTDFFAPFATHTPEETIPIESKQGINLAKAASKTLTLEHYIWSTLPDNKGISNGKCSVPHFESKFAVDELIKNNLEDLHKKAAYLWDSVYATNIASHIFQPNFVATTGKYVQHMPVSPSTPITTRI